MGTGMIPEEGAFVSDRYRARAWEINILDGSIAWRGMRMVEPVRMLAPVCVFISQSWYPKNKEFVKSIKTERLENNQGWVVHFPGGEEATVLFGKREKYLIVRSVTNSILS